MKRWLGLLFLAWAVVRLGHPVGDIDVQLWSDQVILRWAGSAQIFRSTSPLSPDVLEGARLPVARMKGSGLFRDRDLAHGVDYYYLLKIGSRWVSAGPVRLPTRQLCSSQHPWLSINKARYLLSVMEGTRLLKSYPIALGKEPVTRKLCFDNASTPEGRYQISNLQPQATYYRAFDIDYPNATDRARYQLLAPGVDIGGEIQVHGRGITRNWTFGCMALRDQDMDELFAHREIGVGTDVWIYGGELSLLDLQSDAKAGSLDRTALGLRQKRKGLPVTCLFDVATSRL